MWIQAVIKSVVVSIAAVYLFYNSWKAAVLIIPGVIAYLHEWKKEECKKKEIEFREQFAVAIQSMAASLKTGYSVENAIRETVVDLEKLFSRKSRILSEFQRMTYLIDMNRSSEQAIEEFAQRVKQEDVENFAIVFIMAKKSGGDSISMIRSAVSDIREKIETESEIQTMLAAKKMEFRIMCLIPFGIIWYMRFSFPEFMNILYGNLLGVCLMTICLGIYIGAYVIGKRIISIEV